MINFCVSEVQLRPGAASAAHCHDVGWHNVGWHAAHGTHATIASWTLQQRETNCGGGVGEVTEAGKETSKQDLADVTVLWLH